uniref:Uncharacterized protein n=1 Tax=Grammatophora oceanica TaxID=210454 RepID=A0A6U5H584_9STRA|mmetsp:Transcript_16347/g.24195  ORF Transcript_16347/g.24195 Transcript_16347/m.24195 type:complete len:150 (+) Transcript_16347:1602-2051(+)
MLGEVVLWPPPKPRLSPRSSLPSPPAFRHHPRMSDLLGHNIIINNIVIQVQLLHGCHRNGNGFKSKEYTVKSTANNVFWSYVRMWRRQAGATTGTNPTISPSGSTIASGGWCGSPRSGQAVTFVIIMEEWCSTTRGYWQATDVTNVAQH